MGHQHTRVESREAAVPERHVLVAVSGAVLLSIFLLLVVQKYLTYGASADFDAVRSLVFNFLMVVPFVVLIHGGTFVTRRNRHRSTTTRALLVVGTAAVSITVYILSTGGVLYALGLASTWPASPFVGKYAAGAMYVHAALYLFVQIAVDRASRPAKPPVDVEDGGAEETPGYVNRISAAADEGVVVAGVADSEILRLESWDHYVKVFSAGGTSIERATMTKIGDRLPPNFMRVHRSHIVNMDYVERTDIDGRSLYLIVGGERVRVSASYRSIVEQRL